jgi:pyruvate dehydrogenase E2 component (dihydrolipoamide acetyltransferase)
VSTHIILPKLGVEMATARLVEWLVEEAAEVAEGAVIGSFETEKVVSELEAPAAGFIHMVATPDEEYAIGDVLGAIAASRDEYDALIAGSGSGRAGASAATTLTAVTPAATTTVAVNGRGAASSSASPSPTAASVLDARDAIAARRQGTGMLASPIARRVAAAHGVDLAALVGSGPRGAIRRRDVELAIASPAESLGEDAATPVASAAATAPALYETMRIPSMRRTIADRMYASMQSTAQMTDVREHDLTAVVEFRGRAVSKANALGFKLSYTAIFAKAVVMALRVAPRLNSQLLSETELAQYSNVHLGVAVAIPDGLLVPVIREAERLSLRELSEGLTGVIDRARNRTASAEELSGGTVTITNFGAYGSHFGTPILMPPQVAIVGIGAMLDRAIVRAGQLAVGKAMFVSLTVDHRVIDGETAGLFQNELARLFAEPDLLLYG